MHIFSAMPLPEKADGQWNVILRLRGCAAFYYCLISKAGNFGKLIRTANAFGDF